MSNQVKLFINACTTGNYTVAERLIDQVPNTVSGVISGLRMACLNGHIRIVRLILKKHTSGLQLAIALENAAENGHYQIAKLLIKHGAMILGSALDNAYANDHHEVVVLLLYHLGTVPDDIGQLFDWQIKYLFHHGVVPSHWLRYNFDHMRQLDIVSKTVLAEINVPVDISNIIIEY